jgi:pimeloyl-ACP methyl ester carboxylesterase
MRPAIATLAARFRVVSYSLAGERRSTRGMSAGSTFSDLIDQLADVVASRKLQKPFVCGISFRGLVALEYAARHPRDVAGLILVSTPSPGWRPNERLARYRRAPRLYAPVFTAQALRRLLNELAVTYPRRVARMKFLRSYVTTIARRPLSPSRASQRLSLIGPVDFAADCRTLTVPVLIVTGEQTLDQVVPVEDTLRYRSLIPHAVVRTIERTGHLGCLTRPDVFNAIVRDFCETIPGSLE